MAAKIEDLKPGDVLKNKDLGTIFAVGNMGGMRRSHETNSLVIVSDPFKSFYQDKWVGDTLHYTGMGKVGNQSLDYSQNRTLAQSDTNGVSVHLFEVFTPGEYTYIGPVKLVSDPYQDEQEDVEGNIRKVWIYPVKVTEDQSPALPNEKIKNREKAKANAAKRASSEEVKEKANKAGTGKPSIRASTTTAYERNPWVSEFAKRRANGVCELCLQQAPFRDKDGSPFLETHHIDWLANGGADTIENTVALCPNCHRRMHHLNDEKDLQLLKDRASQR